MRPKALAFGGALGILWGVVALAALAAMRAHMVPTPFQVALPLAIGLLLAYLPFVLAAGAETLLGRSTPFLVEILIATITCGAALGVAASAVASRIRH